MTYETAVEALYQLGHELAGTPSHKFDLAHMRVLLDALAHPERRFASVLIAGTNGKGSTAATLSSILLAAGYKTGLYTSPHLVKINERFRINGSQVNDAEFTAAYEHVETLASALVETKALPWHPSFFEMLTAMAFELFARAGIQIAVLEVGMGGRLDATNVVEPLISVIADISLDHQKFLGNTIAEIAAEKAGIIKPNGTVVTLPQHPAANDVIGHAILDHQAKGISAVKHMPPMAPGSADYRDVEGRNRYPLEVMNEIIEVNSPLPGRHQLRNLALAITTAEELARFGFPVTSKQIEQGIRETRWAGRFQVISAEKNALKRELIFDVAHNPDGAWALRSALSDKIAERPLTLVFGAMHDKAFREMVQILFPTAQQVIVTQAKNPRAATTAELAEVAKEVGTEVVQCASVEAAVHKAPELTAENGVIVVTGSIFVVGEAMNALQVET
ncbi:FolC bifunctional protein [Candidatus Koribacter versatilis Ellin345]|uniref:Dihydrofolate synthase/folylpolyglutamate synthase n=1 Tax=Koribacter versatilis (strain Ellin345) TaxID=204669 RepID=Q1IVH6_KORVE|nr:folylpolyglutamate synthase/dihydrofolate synthase family protein [Candidatus Koribacter versatilis]ABF39124.1 FolC bifunctional protein [Candidatus Koribacter versatilis Ellin345]